MTADVATLFRAFAAVAQWVDAWWGYDVFIAHRRKDGAPYAEALHARLTAAKVSAFIDRLVYGHGDLLQVATRRHVSKSSVLVLLGSPELTVPRQPVDWVAEEIATYLATHRRDPRVIVVDFGRTVSNSLDLSLMRCTSPEMARLVDPIAPFLRLEEFTQALAMPPSEEVLDAVRRNLGVRRRDRNRLWLFQGIITVLGALLIAAVLLWLDSEQQRRLSEARRLVAEARASLASPPSTQLALLQARAALAMADGEELRNVASEIVTRVPTPISVLRTGTNEGVALFAAFRSDGGLAVGSIGGSAITSSVSAKLVPHADVPALAACKRVAYARDGRRIACHRGTVVEVWDVDEMRKVDAVPFDPEEINVPQIAIDRTGTTLVMADKSTLFSSTFGSGVVHAMKLPDDGWPPYKMALSSDGRYVALVPGATEINRPTPVYLADLRDRIFRKILALPGSMAALVFTSKGDRVAIGSDSGRLYFVSVPAGELELQLQAVPGLYTIALSDDGRFVASAAKGAVLVQEIASGRELARLSTEGSILCVAFDAVGARLVTAGATASEDAGQIIVWDLMRSTSSLQAC